MAGIGDVTDITEMRLSPEIGRRRCPQTTPRGPLIVPGTATTRQVSPRMPTTAESSAVTPSGGEQMSPMLLRLRL